MHTAVLHPGRDRSLRRRHPWVMSGAVARLEGDGDPLGAAVRVVSAEGEVLGHGHLSPASQIRIRLLAFGKEEPGEDLLEANIAAAVARRAAEPLLAGSDGVRLLNAEGDGLPGLVADRYADGVVLRLSTAGMARRRERIEAALRSATGAAWGWERADAASARREGIGVREGARFGRAPERVWIAEDGRRYAVDVVGGQKTGFYLDQRDARALCARLAAGRRVLDLFAYTGGFGGAAVHGGAQAVTCVESSREAAALAGENLAAAGGDAAVRIETADAFAFVRGERGSYDLLVVDPPPFARRRSDVPRAARAYKDVLLHAFRLAAPGARVLAFACSHHVGPELFRKIAAGAALDAGRPARVLGRLGLPVDHPVSLHHPEGDYLAGLLLEL